MVEGPHDMRNCIKGRLRTSALDPTYLLLFSPSHPGPSIPNSELAKEIHKTRSHCRNADSTKDQASISSPNPTSPEEMLVNKNELDERQCTETKRIVINLFKEFK